jgi:hypothetical protein
MAELPARSWAHEVAAIKLTALLHAWSRSHEHRSRPRRTLCHFVEAVRICEAGGVVCRVGAAFGPARMQAMGYAAEFTPAACAPRM